MKRVQSEIAGRTLVRPFLSALVTLVAALQLPADERKTIRLIHFSDYHSHALPHDSEAKADQGGIARAIGYLRRERARGAFVFSGGDMMNRGSPAWSDKYQCAEWAWFNGIVAAMAYGNHDSDYGPEALARCRKGIRYPLLSVNTVGNDGRAIFERLIVVERNGLRIGVFAVAGPDFETLVRPPLRPVSGARFEDAVAAVRRVVHELREKLHVNAVVMIGHQHRDDDFALARAVAGIDVVFGTHSHVRVPLAKIEGSGTWYIAPYQYLTYVSRVDLMFKNRQLVSVTGELVAVDARMPMDRKIARRVTAMQRALEMDPAYKHLFVPIASLPAPLGVEDLAQVTVGLMRRAARSDIALSTLSSFRASLPRGRLDLETLRAALPYDNEIIVVEMEGRELRRLLEVANRRGSDAEAAITPLREIENDRVYRVAATDYIARVANAYRPFFQSRKIEATGIRVRDEVQRWVSSRGTENHP